MAEMGVSLAFDTSTPLHAQQANSQGWTQVPRTRMVRKLKRLITSSKPMTLDEARRIVTGAAMWADGLGMEERVRLYLFWLDQKQTQLRTDVKPLAEKYERASKALKEARMLEDRKILQEASVIGMTTTGAARYRKVLAEVACPIVILEEAAEVLEAHVVTTLHKAVQHVILIGDHKQLKPSTAVYELRDFKLDLSLFERLVNNKLQHVTLAVQHRMRPEVANLVRHVYPELKDHGTTENRPHIRGVLNDVFLFHHEEEELRNSETLSRSNRHEAELCVRFCLYLLQQGYSPDSITILTAYSGQVFALTSVLKQEEEQVQGVRVTSVDNYQGEENDVIILSLVRNNQDGVVGFLSTDNRVCVALSRARNGLYIFGNFKMLKDSSKLWENVIRTAKERGQLGTKLTLRCENHPNTQIEVTTAKDFDKAPEGGCQLPCGKKLGCGHICRLKCHGYDKDHVEYKCREKCERASACKLPVEERHPCTRYCFQDCGEDCMTRVEKIVPWCGHKALVECHRDPSTWLCKQRCEHILTCAHQCPKECCDCNKLLSHPDICTEMVEKTLPCGHKKQLPCRTPATINLCQKLCMKSLDCSHTCKGICGVCNTGKVHQKCLEKMDKPHPKCGHQVKMECSSTEAPPCGKLCGVDLPCKHPCKGICDVCKSDDAHKQCKVKVEKPLPCGHSVTAECGAAKPPPCIRPCEAKLKCGHDCKGICGDCKNGPHKKCQEKVERKGEFCDHAFTVECGTTQVPVCSKKCDATLVCGHSCRGTCDKCWSGRLHIACMEKCDKPLPGCGHRCPLPCGTECRPCTEKCTSSCSHRECDRPCGTPCVFCIKPCPWKCKHQDCQSPCYLQCKPCSRICLNDVKCKNQGGTHFCSGMCSEECFCYKCEKDNYVPMSVDGATPEIRLYVTKLIKLPRCSHIYNAEVLDVYMKDACAKLPVGKDVVCPKKLCGVKILETDCWRYHRLLRERHNRFQDLKRKLTTATEVSAERRQKLLYSLELLTFDYEKLAGFASKENTRDIRVGRALDANRAFTMTNQIKLNKVMEMICKALKKNGEISDARRPSKSHFTKLWSQLCKPMPHLTKQRHNEIRQEVLRLVYMTQLDAGLNFTEASSRKRLDIDQMLDRLGRSEAWSPRLKADIEFLMITSKYITSDQGYRDLFETMERAVDIASSPSDQDLCDIGKSAPAAKIPATDLPSSLANAQRATTSPRASTATSPRASIATSPRASTATSPRASTATSPRASTATSPRASTATSPRASTATSPRASTATSPRASDRPSSLANAQRATTSPRPATAAATSPRASIATSPRASDRPSSLANAQRATTSPRPATAAATSPRASIATSPRASTATSPRASTATSPRASTATSPRASTATSPRASTVTPPRASTATSPRASTATSPRASTVTPPRASTVTPTQASALKSSRQATSAATSPPERTFAPLRFYFTFADQQSESVGLGPKESAAIEAGKITHQISKLSLSADKK